MGPNVISQIQFITAQVSDSIIRPADTTQYAAGDVIAEVTTNDGLTFAEACDVPKLSGSISTARCISSANQATKPDIELWLFTEAPAEVADNGAFDPSDDELATLVGIIPFAVADWYQGGPTAGAGGNAVCESKNIGIAFKAATRNLYGVLVVRNTYTPVASEQFTVQLVVQKD